MTADGQEQTIQELPEAQRRAAALTAVLNRWPHDDPASLPTELARFAIVQCYPASIDRDSYWVDLFEDPAEGLVELSASYVETGFEPFSIVDLDNGRSRLVDVRFAIGDSSDHSRHDFSDVLL